MLKHIPEYILVSGVKAMMYVVIEIKKIAESVTPTKTFIKFNFNENVSSKVSSFKITSLRLFNSLIF